MVRVWNILFDIICSLFVLASLGYAAWRTLKESEDPTRVIVKWIVTVLIVVAMIVTMRHIPMWFWPPVGAGFAIPIAIIWAPHIGDFVANPIAGMIDGGRVAPEKKPMYSYAQARRNKGQPKEAVTEVLKELAKFPHDINGAILLASIYADDLKDIAGAERAIEEFISQPDLSPNLIAAALQNLADLQWRFGRGGAAASATLKRITAAYPDSPLAHAALQRIAHLEAADQVRQERAATHYSVPTGERNVGLRVGVKAPFQAPEPADEAAELVRQLEAHPADVESRERLAIVYAEQLERADLAVDQLEQLISLRAESPKRIAHWLNLLATVHARSGNDLIAAEETLHRLIERFPRSAMAENAAARLATLAQENKANRASGAIALGSYEKGIGLKTGRAIPS